MATYVEEINALNAHEAGGNIQNTSMKSHPDPNASAAGTPKDAISHPVILVVILHYEIRGRRTRRQFESPDGNTN